MIIIAINRFVIIVSSIYRFVLIVNFHNRFDKALMEKKLSRRALHARTHTHTHTQTLDPAALYCSRPNVVKVEKI